MTEQTCPYCLNEIRSLDQHAKMIKDAGNIVRVDNPNPIKMQEVTCVLTRTVIVNIGQTK